MQKINKQMVKRLVYGILIIIWMITIFNFSSQQSGKSSNTSEVVIKVALNYNNKYKKLEEVEQKAVVENWQYPIRKSAHFTIYLIGGLIIFNFMNTFNISWKKKILFTMYIACAYAISDEAHQLMVDGRSAQITDVLIDTAGAVMGSLIMYLFSKWSKKQNVLKRNYNKNGGCYESSK